MKIWGLDIGATAIKAVELMRTWKGYRVAHFHCHPLPEGDPESYRRAQLQGLREIFAKTDPRSSSLILPIASHRTMTHRVTLPFQDRAKNLQVLKYEVESVLPLPVEQVLVDYYRPREKSNGQEALVFAICKQDLQDHLALLQEVGLDPESVVPEGLALFWLVRQMGKNLGLREGALLDMGHVKTTMIIWQGERLMLVRSIPLTGRCGSPSAPTGPISSNRDAQLFGEVRKVQNPLDHPEVLGRLLDEVQRTLIAYELRPGSQEVKNILLTGGGAGSPAIEQALGERLQRRINLLTLEKGLPSCGAGIPEEVQARFSVALGAALGGAAFGGERINLRQEEFASSKKAKKIKTRVMLLVVYGIVLLLLGVAALATRFYLKEREYQNLKAEIRKEFLMAQPGVKKIVNEGQQLKNALREERARLDAFGGGLGESTSLEILRELSTVIEPGWKIRLTDFVIDPETVEMSGEANSFDTVNRFKAKLDQSPRYKEVQLKTARASGLENLVEFKLQMKLKG